MNQWLRVKCQSSPQNKQQPRIRYLPRPDTKWGDNQYQGTTRTRQIHRECPQFLSQWPAIHRQFSPRKRVSCQLPKTKHGRWGNREKRTTGSSNLRQNPKPNTPTHKCIGQLASSPRASLSDKRNTTLLHCWHPSWPTTLILSWWCDSCLSTSLDCLLSDTYVPDGLMQRFYWSWCCLPASHSYSEKEDYRDR